ncbi:MAG: metal-dependent hydrolase [Chloroflexota bacterium]|nr:metal-dependent hydrolase [Chloroflexota bacterium]
MPQTLTWYGHSAFRLDSGDHAVLVDPFISGNPSATVSAGTVNADTILLTHAHNDHVGDTVDIAKRNNATVIATAELAGWLGTQGIENAIGANHGGTVQFPGGSTKFVPAWHTSSYSTAEGTVAPGVPAGHVVRFGGKTVYFAGDTCLFLDMQLIGEEELDVAVLPIGDHFTMGIKDAARAAGILKATTVIPCHYNTFPPIAQDPSTFREAVESTTASKVVIVEPGASIQF